MSTLGRGVSDSTRSSRGTTSARRRRDKGSDGSQFCGTDRAFVSESTAAVVAARSTESEGGSVPNRHQEEEFDRRWPLASRTPATRYQARAVMVYASQACSRSPGLASVEKHLDVISSSFGGGCSTTLRAQMSPGRRAGTPGLAARPHAIRHFQATVHPP